MFFGFLMNIASFDLLPTDLFYNAYFNLSDLNTVPINSNFESLGYESLYFLRNMGTLMLTFIAIPVFVVVQLLLKYLLKSNKRVRQLEQKISKFLYWNYMITVVIESYSVLCMGAFINLRHVSKNQQTY